MAAQLLSNGDFLASLVSLLFPFYYAACYILRSPQSSVTLNLGTRHHFCVHKMETVENGKYLTHQLCQ